MSQSRSLDSLKQVLSLNLKDEVIPALIEEIVSYTNGTGILVGPRGPMGTKGPIGEKGATGAHGINGTKGEKGDYLYINAIGPLANLSTYSSKVVPFVYYDTENKDLYYKKSNTDGDWLGPVKFDNIEITINDNGGSSTSKTIDFKWNTTKDKLGWKYSDAEDIETSWIWSMSLIGPQGSKGDTGLTGEDGDRGPLGPIGPRGEDGIKGDTGLTGADGKSVEIQWDDNLKKFQYRVGSSGDWQYTSVISGTGTGTGVDGRTTELQWVSESNKIRWKYTDQEDLEINWTYTDSLMGPQGLTGQNGTNGTDGRSIIMRFNDTKTAYQWKYTDEDDTAYRTSIDLSELSGGGTGTEGVGLSFTWIGTELGIKRDDQESYVFVDLKGINGEQGLQGTQGIDGRGLVFDLNSSTGLLRIKYDGQDDIYYKSYNIMGIQGEKGIKGDVGPAGTNGSDGTSIQYVWDGTKLGIKTDLEETFVYTDLTGPIGPTGNTGPIGDIGPQGSTGLQGKDGPQGETGEAGPVGPIGLTGKDGPIGPQGSDGPIGLTGLTGDIGPQGLSGLDGRSIEINVIGTKMYWKYTDETNYTRFIEIPAGQDGLNAESLIFNVENGILQIKHENSVDWEIQYELPIGPAGTNGTDGISYNVSATGIFSERITHDAEVKGFSFLDIDTGILYFKKSNVSADWSVGTQFVGPVGPKGERGIQGDIGLTGLTGPTGDIGPKGEQGIAGQSFEPDAIGLASDKTTHDAELKNFSFLDTSSGLIYFKLSDTSADWSTGIQFSGIQGIKGDTGLTGPKGDIGPKGDAADPIELIWDVNGVKLGVRATGSTDEYLYSNSLVGPKGDTGLKGDTGDTGTQGTAGSNGIDGRSIGARFNEYAQIEIFYLDEPTTTVQTSVSLIGPEGPTGLVGQQGDIGPVGPTPQLEMQWEGPILAIRKVGDTEFTRSASLLGPIGTQGLPGPSGETGPKGETGVGLQFSYDQESGLLGIKKETDVSYTSFNIKGEGLEFQWNETGTQLGVKKENDIDYVYSQDLKAEDNGGGTVVNPFQLRKLTGTNAFSADLSIEVWIKSDKDGVTYNFASSPNPLITFNTTEVTRIKQVTFKIVPNVATFAFTGAFYMNIVDSFNWAGNPAGMVIPNGATAMVASKTLNASINMATVNGTGLLFTYTTAVGSFLFFNMFTECE